MAIGGEVTYVIGSDDKDFNRGIESADRKMSSFGDKSFGIGGMVKGLFTYDMFKGAIQGIKDLTLSTIGYSAMLEQSAIGWETLLGSQEAAVEMQQELLNLAKVTPFDYEGVDKMAKSLSMAGFQGDALFAAVTNIGDAVSAVGGNTETATGAARVLYQMYSKGKVQAEEMLQLSEAGIPAWQILSDQMGVSVEELQGMTKEGTLMAEDVIPLLVKGFGEDYGGAMEDMSQSFNGLMSTIKDQAGQIGSWITTPIFDALKKVLSSVTGWADGILNIIQNETLSHPQMWQGIKDYFIDTINQLPPEATKVAGDIVAAFGSIIAVGLLSGFFTLLPEAFSVAVVGITGLIPVLMGALSGIPGKILPILTKIGGFISSGFTSILGPELIGALAMVTSGIGGVFTALLADIAALPFVAAIGKVTGPIMRAFSALSGYALKTVSMTTSALTSVIGVALSALGPGLIVAAALAGLGLIQQNFGTQLDQLAAIAMTKGPGVIQGFVSGIISALPGLISAGSSLLINFINVITANLPAIFSGGIQIVNGLIQGLVSNLPAIITAIILLVGQLMQGILNAIPQLIVAGMYLLQGLINGIMVNLPLIISTVMQVINTFLQNIAVYLPLIIQMGINLLLSLINGLVTAIPQLLPAIVTIITSMFEAIVSNLPTIIQGAIKIINALVNGLISSMPSVISAVVGIVTAIFQTIIKNGPQILSSGLELMGQLAAGLIKAIPIILSAIGDLLGRLFVKLAEADWGKIGSDMMAGLAKGISGAADAVMSAIGGVLDGALNWAKEKLGIKSPSRVMAREVGQWIPKGQAVGITDNIDVVETAMDTMNKAMLNVTPDFSSAFSLPIISSPVNSYSKDIISVGNKDRDSSEKGKTIIFNQTNNSPENINAREAARLAKIRLQQLGDLAMT